jgi:hypothetical protein
VDECKPLPAARSGRAEGVDTYLRALGLYLVPLSPTMPPLSSPSASAPGWYRCEWKQNANSEGGSSYFSFIDL